MKRQEPEVYRTPNVLRRPNAQRDTPISVRLPDGKVTRLTPTEAGLLAARLLVTGAEILAAIEAEEGKPKAREWQCVHTQGYACTPSDRHYGTMCGWQS